MVPGVKLTYELGILNKKWERRTKEFLEISFLMKWKIWRERETNFKRSIGHLKNLD
jgi:hypothetical protein